MVWLATGSVGGGIGTDWHLVCFIVGRQWWVVERSPVRGAMACRNSWERFPASPGDRPPGQLDCDMAHDPRRSRSNRQRARTCLSPGPPATAHHGRPQPWLTATALRSPGSAPGPDIATDSLGNWVVVCDHGHVAGRLDGTLRRRGVEIDRQRGSLGTARVRQSPPAPRRAVTITIRESRRMAPGAGWPHGRARRACRPDRRALWPPAVPTRVCHGTGRRLSAQRRPPRWQLMAKHRDRWSQRMGCCLVCLRRGGYSEVHARLVARFRRHVGRLRPSMEPNGTPQNSDGLSIHAPALATKRPGAVASRLVVEGQAGRVRGQSVECPVLQPAVSTQPLRWFLMEQLHYRDACRSRFSGWVGCYRIPERTGLGGS